MEKCDICGEEMNEELFKIQEEFINDEPCLCSTLRKIQEAMKR